MFDGAQNVRLGRFMIPAQAETFVGAETGGPDITVRIVERHDERTPDTDHDDPGVHMQVFADGVCLEWSAGDHAQPDLCVHVPVGGSDYLVSGAPDESWVSDVLVHAPGDELDNLPPGDLRPAPDMMPLPGANLILQMVHHDNPFGTLALRQYFEDGVAVRYEWGRGDAQVVVNADYCTVLAYRSGEVDLFDTVGSGTVDGSIPMVSLAAGIIEQDDYREHFMRNAELCRLVRRWALHTSSPAWKAAQALERSRGEEPTGA